MKVYLTIYRGDTAEDEIEINIKGFYDKDCAYLEILEVVNTFDNKPIELTPEERKWVATEEFNEWLYSEGLCNFIGQHRKVYWPENDEGGE
jgi:hypothetical protein